MPSDQATPKRSCFTSLAAIQHSLVPKTWRPPRATYYDRRSLRQPARLRLGTSGSHLRKIVGIITGSSKPIGYILNSLWPEGVRRLELRLDPRHSYTTVLQRVSPKAENTTQNPLLVQTTTSTSMENEVLAHFHFEVMKSNVCLQTRPRITQPMPSPTTGDRKLKPRGRSHRRSLSTVRRHGRCNGHLPGNVEDMAAHVPQSVVGAAGL